MKIYLASSWRNLQQPAVLAALRAANHSVYDFKNPAPGDNGFSWKQIQDEPPPWSAAMTIEVLNTPRAVAGFKLDFDAMKWCDALVMLQPCGRSAAMELGWAAGAGKITVVLLADGQEPELMVKMANHLCDTVENVIDVLGLIERRKTLPSLSCNEYHQHREECLDYSQAKLPAATLRPDGQLHSAFCRCSYCAPGRSRF